ncbi:hypothetical protein GVN24_34805 [Rhizobium sp. CRIBSB]|nr:hypothetical protein [Rhizobium sp. CRIBSB]
MEDFIPVIAILSIFGTITAIAFGPTYLKSKERREMQETVRRAIDKGHPLPPEVIEAMSKDVTKNLPSRTRDIRRGIIWMAVGVGIAAFSAISDATWNQNDGPFSSDAPFAGGPLLGFAAIPITIGLAFIILSFFNKNRD